MAGLISLLTVIRHTRAEEDAGRRELLGATAVGRPAGLIAALIATAGADLVLGMLVALGLLRQGLPAPGSVAFGAELAGGILGASYLARLVGDVSAQRSGPLGWVSWL